MPKLRKWVEERVVGHTLNLFGGVTRLSHPSADGAIIHNDIMKEYLQEGDLNRDAYDLTKWLDLEGSFDTVVFDPPYSAHQAVVSYGVKKAQQVTHARDVVELVLRPEGKVISLGFNTTGMSKSRGFEKDEILIVNCGASHNDYLVTVESQMEVEVAE